MEIIDVHKVCKQLGIDINKFVTDRHEIQDKENEEKKDEGSYWLAFQFTENETTTKLLIYTVRTLAGHSEEWRNNMILTPRMVGMVMSRWTAVQLMCRLKKKKLGMGGAQLRPGDKVLMYIGALSCAAGKHERPHVYGLREPPTFPVPADTIFTNASQPPCPT